jgi:predicted nucleotidyltransferase
MKPHKTLYKNQDDVWEKAKVCLDSLLSECSDVKEAYVWASLAEKKFGLYDEVYRNQVGSDIDLVLVMHEPFELPKTWKYLKVEKRWLSLYRLGYFEYQENQHEIGGLIVIPSSTT